MAATPFDTNEPIGVAILVRGEVRVTDTLGVERALRQAGPLFEDEVVRVAAPGAAAIELVKGGRLDLEGGSLAKMGAEVFDDGLSSAEADCYCTSISLFQLAILQGTDPSHSNDALAESMGSDSINTSAQGHETAAPIVVTESDPIDSRGPVFALLSGDPWIREGQDAGFLIRLIDSAGNPVVVPPGKTLAIDLSYGHLSADSGAFIASSTKVAIIGGNSQTTFSLGPLDEAYGTGDKSFKVSIASLGPNQDLIEGLAIGPQNSIDTLIIQGDGPPPELDDQATLSLSGDLTVAEGVNASYTLTLDKPPAQDLILDVNCDRFDDSSGEIRRIQGEIRIPAGRTSTFFTLAAADDELAETRQDFRVSIANPRGGGFAHLIITSDSLTTSVLPQAETGVGPAESMAESMGSDSIDAQARETAAPIVAIASDPIDFDALDSTDLGTGQAVEAPPATGRISLKLISLDSEGNEISAGSPSSQCQVVLVGSDGTRLSDAGTVDLELILDSPGYRGMGSPILLGVRIGSIIDIAAMDDYIPGGEGALMLALKANSAQLAVDYPDILIDSTRVLASPAIEPNTPDLDRGGFDPQSPVLAIIEGDPVIREGNRAGFTLRLVDAQGNPAPVPAEDSVTLELSYANLPPHDNPDALPAQVSIGPNQSSAQFSIGLPDEGNASPGDWFNIRITGLTQARDSFGNLHIDALRNSVTTAIQDSGDIFDHTIDLSNLAGDDVHPVFGEIETLRLESNASLNLSIGDVLDLTDGGHRLVIEGDSSNQVTLSGMSRAESSSYAGYELYLGVMPDGGNPVTLYLDMDIEGNVI
ncbi:MAG: hypothetical protein KJ558_02670 [Gammaproteobacteria bacterium]|nr:hypothetical protein [Gammaproteobacteria bacterium]MBU1653729.1 hypothetical protein [Gammaproteobacteria bacterium]MBU1960897.1 hypothetical protein [Gammaproteobacteria bacterium]